MQVDQRCWARQGGYRVAAMFQGFEVQTYFEKSMNHNMFILGILRGIDQKGLPAARRSLKNTEDSMITSLDTYANYLEDEHYQFACTLLKDIARYRKENTEIYIQSPSPIDPHISKILTKWSDRKCNQT